MLKETDFVVTVLYEPDSNCIHLIRWTRTYLAKNPHFTFLSLEPKDIFENSPANVQEKLIYYLDIVFRSTI